jgi:hypothetical protein
MPMPFLNHRLFDRGAHAVPSASQPQHKQLARSSTDPTKFAQKLRGGARPRRLLGEQSAGGGSDWIGIDNISLITIIVWDV